MTGTHPLTCIFLTGSFGSTPALMIDPPCGTGAAVTHTKYHPGPHRAATGFHFQLLKKGRLDHGGQLVLHVQADLRCLLKLANRPLKHWAVSTGVIWGRVLQAKRTAVEAMSNLTSIEKQTASIVRTKKASLLLATIVTLL